MFSQWGDVIEPARSLFKLFIKPVAHLDSFIFVLLLQHMVSLNFKWKQVQVLLHDSQKCSWRQSQLLSADSVRFLWTTQTCSCFSEVMIDYWPLLTCGHDSGLSPFQNAAQSYIFP